MTDTDNVPPPLVTWDPDLTKRVMDRIGPVAKWYHRCEVRGLDTFPAGGALVVSNHSGGQLTTDIAVFATGFYEKFGYSRAVYTLSHDLLFKGPTAEFFARTGFIRANQDNADAALRSGGVVIVFPGGDYDAFRPTLARNTVDFNGRLGYVKAALHAGVPIVPAVSIGAQENQLYLSRGEWLARLLGLDKIMRMKLLPITFGFPFGLSAVLPVNLPLPTKIVTQVLQPIDLVEEFGEVPDIEHIDHQVRQVMQESLTRLAEERRFPVLG